MTLARQMIDLYHVRTSCISMAMLICLSVVVFLQPKAWSQSASTPSAEDMRVVFNTGWETPEDIKLTGKPAEVFRELAAKLEKPDLKIVPAPVGLYRIDLSIGGQPYVWNEFRLLRKWNSDGKWRGIVDTRLESLFWSSYREQRRQRRAGLDEETWREVLKDWEQELNTSTKTK